VPAWFEFAGLSFLVGVEQRSVSLSGAVDRGRVMLVRGPSGAGKTTLLRVLARLQHGTGDVWLGGRHWHSFAPTAWRAAVCYVAQQPAVFEGTVRDNLRRPFQLTAVGRRRRYDAAAAERGMRALMLPPALLEQDARLLSGGEAVRIAVLRALLADPAVLLLDEPTAALDRPTAAGFCDLLNHWLSEKPDRRAAVVITHDEFVVHRLRDPVFLEMDGGDPGRKSISDVPDQLGGR